MYWQKRKERGGKVYFSFAFHDPVLGRNVRLRRTEVPFGIETEEQADQFCRLKEAEHEAARLRIQRKLEWRNKFYDFSKLLEQFTVEIKKMAPNSWENSLYYLEHYAFPFFLGEKQCNNLNNWSAFYEEFIEWLLNCKTSKGDRPIAYSTRNHVISSLNSFMVVMKRKGQVAAIEKCQKFPTHLLKTRTAEDVLSGHEAEAVHEKLTEISKDSADFFWVLLHSGMRLSEGRGLSFDDIYEGEVTHEVLKKLLKQRELNSFGYISLWSQLAEGNEPRDGHKVLRKPLKGRRKIDPSSGRTIPILDKRAFNILVSRFNECSKQHSKKVFGDDPRDYLLFDGLTKGAFASHLKRAYEALGDKYRPKSAHCLRHTFATELAGMALGDTTLCKNVLGHKDEETTQRYVHLFEQINQKAKMQGQRKRGMQLVE